MMSSFFFQAEDGIRDKLVTGVQTCALPIFQHLAALLVVEVVDQQEAQLVRQALLERHLRAGAAAAFEIAGVEIGRARVGKECRSRGPAEHEKKKAGP